MKKAIETQDLSKQFEIYQKPQGLKASLKAIFHREVEWKMALAPTNLSLNAGQIVGLIGANGAGKTTLLKLLCGLITPTSGSLSVLGHDPSKREYEFLRRMSILLGQKNQLWWDISPVDSFDLLARIYDLDLQKAKKRVHELADVLQCTSVLQTQLRRLSLGERMKMELIGALLHSPEILFLDEPTIGLDLVAQESIRTFLSTYVKEFKPTIILTSHYMDDITTLADSLLLISKGRIVYEGNVQHFMEKEKQENITNSEVDFEEIIRRFLETESRVF